MTTRNNKKILDSSFVEKILSNVKEPARKDFLEKQLNASVNTFLGFSYSGKDHPTFEGGTVNNIEFYGLKKLAKEAGRFKEVQ